MVWEGSSVGVLLKLGRCSIDQEPCVKNLSFVPIPSFTSFWSLLRCARSSVITSSPQFKLWHALGSKTRSLCVAVALKCLACPTAFHSRRCLAAWCQVRHRRSI